MIGDRQIFLNRHGLHVAQSILKVSNFTPNFVTLQETSTVDPFSERKKLASSNANSRKAVQTSPVKLRALHSSQLARNSPDSQFQGVAMVQTSSLSRYRDQISLQSGQNTHQLREIMRQRVAVFKHLAKQQNSHAFRLTEYHMKPAEREKWNRTTLHTRKINQSPFVKALKPKKSISISYETSPERIDPKKDTQNKRKMVLLGGSIPVRSISSNPEERGTFSPLKTARKQLASGNVSVVRKSKQVRQRGNIQYYENDCQPWDIQRQGMEESSNIYQYSRRG